MLYFTHRISRLSQDKSQLLARRSKFYLELLFLEIKVNVNFVYRGEIAGRQCKIFSCIGDQEGAISDPV